MRDSTRNEGIPEGVPPAASGRPAAAPECPPGPDAPPAGDEPIGILLVDDEPRNLTVLETVLDHPDYRLVRAVSAEQALLALVADEFAVLIVDIQMPGMSGLELAHMVKQRKKTACIPIIFLTAHYGEDRHVLDGYGAGGVDYLHKPIEPSILKSKVAVFADLHRKSREVARANEALREEVSARRHAEEQLRQLNEELERRVADRTADLVRANEALARREAELRSLAENSPDILARFDAALRPIFVNAAAEKVLGRPREAILGLAAGEAEVPGPLRLQWQQALRAVFASRRARAIEFDFPLRGKTRHYATRLIPEASPTGEVATVLAVTQDVTELKRTEEALQHADRRKDEFLATLAHELRNPLAPIRTGLHLLGLSQDPDLATRTREMMNRQLSHMVRLIDDLLDISRITSGKVTLRKEQVSLRAVAEAAVEASRPAIEAARHALSLDLPAERVTLPADPTRLAQVITNLLTNAAKYTPEGGRIELSAAGEGREAVIRVRDTGMGIPPAMLEEVFEMFTQVNRTLDRAQGGLGIGLALVKRLVELHGGAIAAASDGLGLGSTFTVRIPIPEPAGAGESPAAPPGAPASTSRAARRVLVVDDNEDMAEVLAGVLRLAGHEVRTALDGPGALEEARSFRADVVFLDIGLPGMSGYEVARRLRRDPASGDALIVALTGGGLDEDKRQAKEAGIDLHLTKPVEFPQIEEAFSRLPRREPPAAKAAGRAAAPRGKTRR
ncbi:Aerobic respiration control sensor protein ArcB [Aquisphaera giovannonii]|uniref:histidine kinase n=1 Tax=Aquisphaera giovannonii TaxID=406548 RepID=A0A5B9W3K7_9BACT|nr:response regulator [Aquisphaera giovannonii]QEH34530.1 Aerobic respiration control sensor protein ArcB [Aquisphaera giovannonii]